MTSYVTISFSRWTPFHRVLIYTCLPSGLPLISDFLIMILYALLISPCMLLASFRILSNLLLTNHPIIRRYITQADEISAVNKPRINQSINQSLPYLQPHLRHASCRYKRGYRNRIMAVMIILTAVAEMLSAFKVCLRS